MKTYCRVNLLIVSYNSEKVLRDSIESCLNFIEEVNGNVGTIIVYDNASSDGSIDIIDEYSELYPDNFIGIKSAENLGFGKANNRAFELSPPSDFCVLVNPDVSFQPEIIHSLLKTFEVEKNVAIVAPKLLYKDGSTQPSIRRFPSFAYFVLRNLLGYKLQQAIYPFDYTYESQDITTQPLEVDWLIGAFMALRTDYIQSYGLFDERFFLYFEDVSMCADAWERGYRVLYQPGLSATHAYEQASTRGSFNYLTLVHAISAFKFFAKHRPSKKRWKLVSWFCGLQGAPIDKVESYAIRKKLETSNKNKVVANAKVLTRVGPTNI